MSVWALIFGLIGTVVSVITLTILLVRGVLSAESRLAKLETRMEPFTEGLNKLVVDALSRIVPGGNPIDPMRYQYLLDRMNLNALTPSEGQELNTVLVELQQEARQANDLSKLLAVGLGLLILAALLQNK